MAFCYTKIMMVLSRRITSGLKDLNSPGDMFQTARKNTLKTFLSVSICFFICWVCNEVYYLMYHMGYDADWDGNVNKFATLMTFCNCTIYLFIYLVKYRDYQIALKHCFACKNQQDSGIDLREKPSCVSNTVISAHN